ncbi:MAG: tyrosine-type recombinase/integrase [Proteobacteria bacterium]|nr:tyrosine-type recombinase/integrase [Pseudomonadota bacterium]
MLALIDEYRKELGKINVFAPSTIETYTIGVKAFCQYANAALHINPATAKADHLLQWLLHLKHSGIGHSRLENHHYSLKSFFAFVHKAGLTDSNPADVLPLLIHRRRERTNPINASDAFKLLASFDRNSWTGLRDYTMVSILWALGLRTSELTGLNVRDFEPAHGKRIGLLRIRGKNKKQRALFVVDRLFDQLVGYLAHPQSPRKKLAPMFPADTKKTAISNSRLQRIVKDQAKKAGISTEVTPRVLRHSFATEMYHKKVPLTAICAMMGHDAIADTAVYVHVSDQLIKQVLDAVSVCRRWS